MSDKKATKKDMEEEFSGKPRVGMTKSGEEEIPSEKFTLAARKADKGTKGEDFKGDGQGEKD